MNKGHELDQTERISLVQLALVDAFTSKARLSQILLGRYLLELRREGGLECSWVKWPEESITAA